MKVRNWFIGKGNSHLAYHARRKFRLFVFENEKTIQRIEDVVLTIVAAIIIALPFIITTICDNFKMLCIG